MEEPWSSSDIASWVPGKAVRAYSLIRQLARGGMGEIWLAKHRGAAGFERLVVLKRIIASADEEPAFVEMFLDEARIASHLHHPNVVQVSELGQEGSSYYMVMEYLAGQTLGRVARRIEKALGAVPETMSVEIVAAAARGLGYAHRRKGPDGEPLHIVHRDVSPQNILVTYEGLTKVLDFGIAKAAGRLARTRTGMVKGKVSYMSPEQAVGQPVTAASDVFSLGTILFELVTGSRLWGEVDDFAILQRLAKRLPPPKPSSRAAVDRELEKIIVKAMDVDEAKRFVDGDELADALEAWLRAHPKDRLSLRDTMQRSFEAEIGQLSTSHSQPDLTPSDPAAMSKSLPRVAARAPPSRRPVIIALSTGIVVATAALVGLLVRPVEPPPVRVISSADDGTADAGVTLATAAPTPALDAGLVVELEAASPDAGAPEPTVVLVDAGTPTPSLAPTRVARRGRLTLDTDPWTQVFEGKRDLGETPLIEYAMPAGRHRLRLVNPSERIDTTVEVDVPPDGGLVVKKLAF